MDDINKFHLAFCSAGEVRFSVEMRHEYLASDKYQSWIVEVEHGVRGMGQVASGKRQGGETALKYKAG